MSGTERSPEPWTGRALIDGDWVPGRRGTFPVEDPASGEVIGTVADCDAGDGLAALDAADRAFPRWRAVSPRDRADVLRRAYELMIARRDELARLVTLEMGKPLAEAAAEVTYAAGYLRWYAEEAVRIGGRTAWHEDGAGRMMTFPRPVGPCLFVTPWNFPLAMGTRKIGPALAAGCPVVVKPASQAPSAMLALGQLLVDAGAPNGVVSIVPTSDVASLVGALIEDPRLRKISFTGSTAVGRRLIAAAAPQVLRVSMELGGNAPLLVFDDADLDRAVEGAILAKTRNGGEACTSANRILVHERIAAPFVERFAARMRSLAVGPGRDEGVELGPLIDERQVAVIDELVDDAVTRGAKIEAGGQRLDRPGYFYAPTVLSDVPDGAAILREEIFGPVAPVSVFADDEQAIRAANDTEYGLVAYVFTQDIDRALRVIDRLETGMVGLNQGVVANVGAPFGGVKASGYGREGGPEGLEEYLQTQYVAIAPSGA